MSNAFDQYTSMDEKIDRTNQLLASLVDAQGTSNLPENVEPVPYATITVPDDADYLGTVPGKTTVDFAEGRVENEHVGTITESIGSIRDVSRHLDVSTDQLRSLYVYADAPVQLSFDGENRQTLEAGNHYTFTDSGFGSVEIRADETVDFTMAAGTRRSAYGISATAGHSTRVGNRTEGSYDTYERMLFASPNVWDDFNSANYPATKYWYVRPFGKKTIQVHNGSTNANDADVRVLAADDSDPKGPTADDPNAWYEIAAVSNLSQGDRHKFVVDEPHRMLTVEFRNSTDGNDVAVGATAIGGTN